MLSQCPTFKWAVPVVAIGGLTALGGYKGYKYLQSEREKDSLSTIQKVGVGVAGVGILASIGVYWFWDKIKQCCTGSVSGQDTNKGQGNRKARRQRRSQKVKKARRRRGNQNVREAPSKSE